MSLYPQPKPLIVPIVQADLIHTIDKDHIRTMTTWLDKKKGLAKGAKITLKDSPKIIWTVKELYTSEHENAEFDWHRKWDNNI